MTPSQLATALVEVLRPSCQRITIAGSVRRERPDPHDVELVIEPTPLMFDHHLACLSADGTLRPDPVQPRDGPRYKRRLYDGFPVDIFIVEPPAQWGLTLAIRTGSARFSQGLLARWKRVSNGGFSKDGCLHARNGVRVPTHEEDDVFARCDLPFILPTDRNGALDYYGPGPRTEDAWDRSQVSPP